MSTSESRADGRHDLLKLEYEQTNENFRALAETRFKLLGLLPIFGGAAIFVLSFLGLSPEQSTFVPTADHLWLVVGVSMLGFVTTLGIVFYDQRNSELYNSLIHRAKFLEQQFATPLSPGARKKAASGGQFSERASPARVMLGTKIRHDKGLALIYGPVLGAWFFPALLAVTRLLGRALIKTGISNEIRPGIELVSILAAMIFALAAIVYFTSHLIKLDTEDKALWDEAGREAVLVIIEKTDSGYKASAPQLDIKESGESRKEVKKKIEASVKQKRLELEDRGVEEIYV